MSKKGEFDFILHHDYKAKRFPGALKPITSDFKQFSSEEFVQKFSYTYRAVMASRSSNSNKEKKGLEMLVKGAEWKVPNFKIVLAIAKSLDHNGAQSQIPLKVLLINDIHTHFKCSILDIGNLEMENTLG